MKFEPKQSDKVHQYRKDKHFKAEYILFEIKDNKPQEVVMIREYGTGNTCYSVVWVNYKYTPKKQAEATGVGKDMYYPDASQKALISAGFTGLPSNPSPYANLEAIAAFFTFQNFYIHYAHA